MLRKTGFLISGFICFMLLLQIVVQAAKPTVNTLTYGNGGSGITLRGEVYSNGGNPILTQGFIYGTSPSVLDSTYLYEGVKQLKEVYSGSVAGLLPNTTYYYKAFATNADGETYGGVKTFTTGQGAPSVTAATYANVTTSGAELTGSLLSDGGNPVTERGFLYSTTDMTPVPANLNDGTPKIVDPSIGGSITGTLTGLQRNTTYYVWAYAKNAEGVTFSTKTQFTTLPDMPSVMTDAISEVTGTGAKFAGTVTSDGDGAISERGFLYTTTDMTPTEANLTDSTPKLTSAGGVGAMSETASGLQPGTTYYVWAYAKNTAGVTFGSKEQFSTPAVAPSVTTGAVSEVTGTGAKFAGTVTSAGGGVISERGFLYTTTDMTPTEANLTDGTPKLTSAGGVGAMSETASGLQPGTPYYVWAYAKNTAGVTFGGKEQFTTPVIAPSVTTGTITEVTGTGAKFAGTVTSTGGGAISERGFLYTTTDMTPVEANLTDGTPKLTSGVDAMSETASGLQPVTTYYVWAYAKNTAGVTFGSKEQFTTLAVAPSVTTGTVSEVTGNGAKFAGTVTSDGGGAISERGFLYTTTDMTPVAVNLTDGTPKLTSGVDAMSETASGLQPGTTYYVWAYAKNTAGVTFGSKEQFTTLAVAPSVTTGTITEVTGTGAKFAGTVTSTGGGAISERGFLYTTTDMTPTAANLTDSTPKLTSAGGVGAMSETASGLQLATTYYVWAYAKNTAGVTFGGKAQFTTLAIVKPTVESGAISAISTSEAIIAGNVLSDGYGTITERGVVYATHAEPTVADAKSINATVGTGEFSQTLTGLTAGTKYYARAYAINSAGVAYGAVVEFTTDSEPDSSSSGGPSIGGPAAPKEVRLVVTDPNNGSATGSSITTLIGGGLQLSGEILKADGTPANLSGITISASGAVSLTTIPPTGEYKLLLYVVAPSGEKLAGRTAKLTVDSTGNAELDIELIDPYGTITDSVTGKPIDGVEMKLIWADSALNKEKGRVVGEQVQLPKLPDFAPNQNRNPQSSKDGGQYGWMVYPDGDYYLIGEKDGYITFDSRKDMRDERFGEDSFVKNGLIHVGVTIVKYDFRMDRVQYNHKAYLQGYEDGAFRPNVSITRAELATVLTRVLPAAASGNAVTVTDIDSHWAAQAIRTVVAQGWMSGYPSGEFAPDQLLTRAEFAQVLLNVRHLKPASASAFSDVSSHWGLPAIAAVEREGWMNGYEDGRFLPDRAVTRAEAVAVFNKLLDRTPHVLDLGPIWSDVSSSFWGYADIMEASIDH